MLDSYFQKIEGQLQNHFQNTPIDWEKKENLQKVIKMSLEATVPKQEKIIQDRLYEEYFGYGPLHSFLQIEDLKEIIINSPSSIWIEDGEGFKRSHENFLSEKTYKNFVFRLLEESGMQVDINKPCRDGKWKEFRIHVISPPLTYDYPQICLRKQTRKLFSLEALKEKSWATADQIEFIKKMVQEKENFLLVGNTSTGKTTVMGACLNEVRKERVVVIEDTDEIPLPNPLSTKLLTRENASNLKTYDQSDLIKQSLRMRPDRLILGEVRGGEAKDFLLTLSTGHKGCFCSLHANDPQHSLMRLEMLVQMGAPQWDLQLIRRLIFSSIKYIMILEKSKKKRFLEGIYKITSLEKFGFLVERSI